LKIIFTLHNQFKKLKQLKYTEISFLRFIRLKTQNPTFKTQLYSLGSWLWYRLIFSKFSCPYFVAGVLDLMLMSLKESF